jgi:hypothetical protein
VQFPPPVFTGAKWNQVGKLPAKKQPTKQQQQHQQQPGHHHKKGDGSQGSQ